MCVPGTVEVVRGQVKREDGLRVGRRALLVGGVASAAAAGGALAYVGLIPWQEGSGGPSLVPEVPIGAAC
jgi:hypothetical protein